MSDVTPSTPPETPQTPLHDIYIFELWQLQSSTMIAHIFPGVICNIVVKAHLAHLTTNASWNIYYGMYLAAILDSSKKGGNFLLFLNN